MRTLSYQKLETLLNRYSYSQSTFYVEKESVRMIQCQTPTVKKTFVLYIPEKFTMKPPLDKEIVNITYEKNGHHEDFQELVGDASACGISGDKIVVCRGRQVMYYRFGEVEEEVEELGTVDALVKEAEELGVNIDSVEDDELEEPGEETVEEGDDQQIEFIGDDGEVYDETKEMMYHLAEESLEAPPPSYSDLSFQTTDNSMFDMDGQSVDIGMIYLVIDIPTFFKEVVKLPNSESIIMGKYTALIQREKEGQKTKYTTIKGMLDELGMKLEEKITNHQITEQKIDIQLKRLTLILAQCRASINKGGPQFKELYARTQRTIADFNFDLIKRRDDINNSLSNCKFVLSQLLNEL